MTIKPNRSHWHKLRRWPTALAASAALAVGAASVVGAPPRDCLDCRYSADGVCRPNAETYGYYQTQWRTWPKPLVVQAAGGQREPIKLPTQVEPPPTQEDLDNAPRPPLLPDDMGDVPPVKPATGNDSPKDHPRPAGGEQLPMPPQTDKPDPFRDDPVQDNDRRNDRRRETSILIPPLDGPIGAYGLLDEAPPVPTAVRSSYDEVRRATSDVIAASDQAALRLIGDASPTLEPTRAKENEAASAVGEAADAGNPLRSGWGVRGASPLREPNVVTKFGGAAANPLRR